MTNSHIVQPSSFDGPEDGRPAKDQSAVGYRHPPLKNRFMKGRSGNPRGRPKDSWSGKDLLQNALAIRLTVTESGIVRKLPQRDILFRSLIAKAIKGDTKSLALILKLIDKWKIYQSTSTVKTITRVVVEPDGIYYDLALDRKASIHDLKPEQNKGVAQTDGGDRDG